MNFPRLAVRANAAPVVQPKRQIALLLDFRQHNPRPDRMHGLSRHIDAVAGNRRDQMQRFLYAAVKCLTVADVK